MEDHILIMLRSLFLLGLWTTRIDATRCYDCDDFDEYDEKSPCKAQIEIDCIAPKPEEASDCIIETFDGEIVRKGCTEYGLPIDDSCFWQNKGEICLYFCDGDGCNEGGPNITVFDHHDPSSDYHDTADFGHSEETTTCYECGKYSPSGSCDTHQTEVICGLHMYNEVHGCITLTLNGEVEYKGCNEREDEKNKACSFGKQGEVCTYYCPKNLCNEGHPEGRADQTHSSNRGANSASNMLTILGIILVWVTIFYCCPPFL